MITSLRFRCELNLAFSLDENDSVDLADLKLRSALCLFGKVAFFLAIGCFAFLLLEL